MARKKWSKEMVVRCFREDKTPAELDAELGSAGEMGELDEVSLLRRIRGGISGQKLNSELPQREM